ncbi:hypothetical protein LCGC14_0583500 [marine sediment metagenome]|uniref:DUF6851 domain-containing protein n=2 Tax=root TaxID=1 RepID=A0A0F9U1W5_9ZZZZ|nr:phosphatase PAP2 family protein [Maribacter sp.]
MKEYYYSDIEMFRKLMVELGPDPYNISLDPTTPEGVGNLAAKATIEAIKNDGSNQYGEVEGLNGEAYSPDIFLCPPFPSYTSGHSTISSGCAEVLRLFTGDDYFGESIELIPGTLSEIDSVFYGQPVTISFPTFTEAANMAGMSRVMGGSHIQADNIAGLQLGRDVATQAWKFYNTHLGN